MTETTNPNPATITPPEGWQVGMPGENGFHVPVTAEQSVVPPEAQRIYDTVADYHDTIQGAYGEDISTLGAEADAWVAAADIAIEVEKNPTVPLTESQHDLLGAVEAHSATFKATSSFTAEQRGTLTKLNETAAGNIVHTMVQERRALWDSTSDEQEREKVESEMSELREYGDMLVNDEAKFDVADIDTSVAAYEDGGKNVPLQKQSEQNTKANAYFSKYAPEIVSKAASEQPATQAETVTDNEQESLSRSEQLTKIRDEEMKRIYNDPEELLSEVVTTRANFFTERLQKMRERATAEPTLENKKHLKTFEKEAEGFTRLLEFADQWQANKLNNPDTADFATYMSDAHTAAEAQFEVAIDAAGGKLAGGSAEALNFERIDSAYRAGWAKNSSYSLSARMVRRTYQKALSRLDSV